MASQGLPNLSECCLSAYQVAIPARLELMSLRDSGTQSSWLAKMFLSIYCVLLGAKVPNLPRRK